MNVLNVRKRLQRDRRAFTLVELLVVITLISILTAMTVFTLFGVQEDAKETRTRAIIAKIDGMIAQKWDSYRTRALPIRISANLDPRRAAAFRLNAVRELMRMELPDRKSDLWLRNSSGNWIAPDSVANPALYYATTPVGITSPPSAWLSYQRRIAANRARGNTWTNLHEHAECLYMILAATRDGNSTALEWFSEKEIGDTDNDGMPEILDAWGRPIYFLRWAPGFISDRQNIMNPGKRTPDPFDPLRVDPRWENNDDTLPETKLDDPFALFPLIYSGGRDRLFGVVRKDYDASTTPPTDIDVFYQLTHVPPFSTATHNPSIWDFSPLTFPPPAWPSATGIWVSRPMNDPYMILPTSGDYIGRRFVNGNADDDITNHLLEVR